MESNELRIGNYVKDPYDKTIKLVNVDGDANMLRPIPLTEEWLLKFGFWEVVMVDDVVGYCHPNNQFIWVNENQIRFECEEDGVIMPYKNDRFKHVHQLQNIYFALTGEELEIKEYESKLG